METLAAFPDAEAVVMALLDDLGTVVTLSPLEIAGPYIRVNRVGGADDGITDRVRVEIICYHVDRPSAVALAALVRQRIAAAGCTTVGGVLIDRAYPEVAAVHDVTRTPDARTVPAVYRFEWRRPAP